MLPNSVHQSPDVENYRFFPFGCCLGPTGLASLEQFQRETVPQYFSLPAEERLGVARAYCLCGPSRQHPDVNVFTFLIRKGGKLRPNDYKTNSTRPGCSLIHSIAISMGRAYRRMEISRPRTCRSQEAGWARLLRKVLMGAWESRQKVLHLVESVQPQRSIHVGIVCKTNWTGTALLSVLKASVAERFWESNQRPRPFKQAWKEWQSIPASALRGWLSRLAEFGVDLLEYGRQEQKVLFHSGANEGATALDFLWTTSWRSRSKKEIVEKQLPIRLCHIDVGCSPNDWLLAWDIDVEKIAGEFWRFVDSQSMSRLSIPEQGETIYDSTRKE